jgi:KDO2-lipid IV(A) lauroyltransferase
MRAALSTLREGGTLGALIDVNMLKPEGVFVDFFGTPASTSFALAKLALRTGAAAIPLFIPWDERRKRFVLQISPPLTIDQTGNEEEDTRRLTATWTKAIENKIREYPDQWLWIHKRWRTRPNGEPDFYANQSSPNG